MPATTRSAGKQTKLEDVGAGAAKQTKSSATKASSHTTTAKKRKAVQNAPHDDGRKPAKQAKKKKTSDKNGANDSDAIIINRAPILELWASCVTRFTYPSVSWETCLSVGGAISTITAISKGRSIGTMKKPDPGEAQAKREKRKEQADKDELEELKVMSFNLRLKDGQAVVGDKPKKGNEDTLRMKYGGPEKYDKVRTAFEESLRTWEGKDDELNEKAFHMYEVFRPHVNPGQAGWGRKGQLDLDVVREAVCVSS